LENPNLDIYSKFYTNEKLYHLLGFVEKALIRSLLEECAKMHEFDHPNVLKLTGVCLDGGPAPFIVMPFMSNGSLLGYLKKERSGLVLEPNSTKDVVSNDIVHFNYT